MADLLATNPNLILVLPRLGIPLGFAERTVEQVCAAADVSTAFLLLICNSYTFPGFEPDPRTITSQDIHSLISYLKASHHYYTHQRLPHISRHLLHVSQGSEERYRNILMKFFEDYCTQVSAHFQEEETELLPRLLTNTSSGPQTKPTLLVSSHQDLHNTLDDFIQILYKYIPSNEPTEEFFEMVSCLIQLSYDLQHHSYIEEMILMPLLKLTEGGSL